MGHLPMDINLTYIIGALVLSLPGWFSAIGAYRQGRRTDNKLDEIHKLTNSNLTVQTELKEKVATELNEAIEAKAVAETELRLIKVAR